MVQASRLHFFDDSEIVRPGRPHHKIEEIPRPGGMYAALIGAVSLAEDKCSRLSSRGSERGERVEGSLGNGRWWTFPDLMDT